MVRPPKSKNKPKADQPTPLEKDETAYRTGTQGQSASEPERRNRPTAEQNAGWLSELTKLKTASRAIAGDISALASRVKAAAGPIHWKSIQKVHDLKKLDRDEALGTLESLIEIAAQNDIRVTWMGNQAAFADVMEQNQPAPQNTQGSRDLAEARAESDGINSGRNGAVPPDYPFKHQPGSVEYVAWHNGRDEGQKQREGKRPAEAARVAEAATADDTLPDDALLSGVAAAVAEELAEEPIV